jgi:hypothetical protein
LDTLFNTQAHLIDVWPKKKTTQLAREVADIKKAMQNAKTHGLAVTTNNRLLAETNWPWSDKKNPTRDWVPLIRCALFEEAFIDKYRTPLMKLRSVCVLRSFLQGILEAFIIPRNVLTTGGGAPMYERSSEWTFCDALHHKTVHKIKHDLEENWRKMESRARRRSALIEVTQLVKKIEKSSLAKFGPNNMSSAKWSIWHFKSSPSHGDQF